MIYFSTNAFYLGAFISALGCLTSLIYCLICFVWKIKILEITLFASPKFSIFEQKILGTDFKLGWIPTGSSVTPLGYYDDPEERSKIDREHLSFALFSKPKYVKYLFILTPMVVYFITFMIIIGVGEFDLVKESFLIFNYIWYALQEMFSGSKDKTDFISYSKLVIENKNLLYFSFLVTDILIVALSIPTLISNVVFSSENIGEKFKERLQILFFLCFAWIILWKIPKFILSFFSLSQDLIYIFSFVVGLFAFGFVFFFTSVFMIKNISQNVNEKLIK